MSRFLGFHDNRLDAKGRVSVPAPYRAVLKPEEGVIAVVLRRHPKNPCIEGYTVEVFNQLTATKLAQYEPFSDDYEIASGMLFAESVRVEPDKDGRIVLPEWLAQHANLSDSVTFMGLGSSFQIWEPEAGKARRAQWATPPAQTPARTSTSS